MYQGCLAWIKEVLEELCLTDVLICMKGCRVEEGFDSVQPPRTDIGSMSEIMTEIIFMSTCSSRVVLRNSGLANLR